MDRYQGRAWEERFLPRLSTKEVEALPKEEALLILPIGSVEQHGPHLPIFTDTLIGETLLTAAIERLPETAQVWLLPPVPYGKSNEHLGFPGTFSLSALTLQAIVSELAKSARESGFRRLLLFNTHGGNHDLLNMMMREIRIETGLMVFVLNAGALQVADDLLDEKERLWGIHGGDYETSLLMAAKPNWIHASLRPTSYPEGMTAMHYLTIEGKIPVAWVTRDLSDSGMVGDATRATAEKGAVVLQRAAEKLAEIFLEMTRFTMAHIKEITMSEKEQEVQKQQRP